MLRMRSSSASPPRRPHLCSACGCSCRPFPLPCKRKSPEGGDHNPARVDERAALREALARGSEAIEDLRRDLEEERSASSTAANEAMSMILRLQREKAEVQMEARQFRQFAEDKIAHDHLQITSLEDECLRRDEAVDAVLHQLRSYRLHLLALGIDPDSPPEDHPPHQPPPPPPRCPSPAENNHSNFPGDTHTLTEIEQRISEMEVMDKTVVGTSPRHRHSRTMSAESVGSFRTIPEIHPPREQGTAGDDPTSDRVYTIDPAVYRGVLPDVSDECPSTPRGPAARGSEGGDGDIRKLYVRLQALEADRESLKQEIVSMRTEKAQMVLLKEIAENLSRGIGGAAQPPPAMERGGRKDPPLSGLFSFLSSVKVGMVPALGLSIFLCWRATSRR